MYNIHQFPKGIKLDHSEGSKTRVFSREQNPDGFIRDSRMLHLDRGQKPALTQYAERVYASQETRNNSVLEQLTNDNNGQCPYQPPNALRRRKKFSLRGWKISPILDEGHLDVQDIQAQLRSTENLDEERDKFFWVKLHHDSQMAAFTCKQAQMADGDRSPTTSMNSFSSVDTHTPTELRSNSAISNPIEVPVTLSLEETTFHTAVREKKLATPYPSPVPTTQSEKRKSRLPVFSVKADGAQKAVADGIMLQSANSRVHAVWKTVQKLLPGPIHLTQLPNSAKKTSVVMPLAKTCPTVYQTVKKESEPETFEHPVKPVIKAGRKAAGAHSLKTTEKEMVTLKPLTSPLKSMLLCFKLLSSDDWRKKMESFQIVQALAQNHSGVLKTKLHEMCLALCEEVTNLRSSVACGAINAIDVLYIHLEKAMDSEVEGTCRALLLKLAQTKNAFIHQQVNLALDDMVVHCTHGRIVSALLNTGLSHRCVTVRVSMAQHLHQVFDSVGASYTLTAGRMFTERFLAAVAKMSLDAAPEVRHHGRTVLQELALHGDFFNLWMKIVPDKDRRPLDKILNKVKNCSG